MGDKRWARFGGGLAATILFTFLAGCVRMTGPGTSSAPLVLPPETVTPVPVFADETEKRGLPAIGATTCNWLDYDNDGWPDLLVDGTRLVRNGGSPDFRFQDVTAEAGLTGSPGGSVLAIDYDLDGRTDIIACRGRVWRNVDGKHFADVTAAVGFHPHAKACVLGAGDFDGDGYPDLFVGMGEDWNNGDARCYPAQLWMNRGGQTFEEVSEKARINRSTYVRGVLCRDIDGDGRQDIYVVNYRLKPNLFWRNLGNGRFAESAEEWRIAGRHDPKRFYDAVTKQRYGPLWGHGIGACWLDFDNDGALDLFVANLAHKFVGAGRDGSYDIRGYVCGDSPFYHRDQHGFTDWRDTLDLPPKPIGGAGVYKGDELWAGCTPGDVNNDGWTDVFVPQIYNLAYARSCLFLNQAGHGFVNVAEAAGLNRIDTYAGAWADIDRDGNLDLATGGRAAVDAPSLLRLYRNRGRNPADSATAPNRWIEVRLARAPGRPLLGARVTVSWGNLCQVQECQAGLSSYSQQNDPVLHFGLGPAGAAQSAAAQVTISWPDGAETTADAPPDTLVTISDTGCAP